MSGSVLHVFRRLRYRKYILPVVPGGVLHFLGSDHFKTCLQGSSPICVANADEIIGSLSKDCNADWRKMVFGIKSVKVSGIRAFFFQLFGSKILGFEWANKTKEVHYVLHKDDKDNYNYKKQSFWSGFEFREARHGANVKSYFELKDDADFRAHYQK